MTYTTSLSADVFFAILDALLGHSGRVWGRVG